MNHLMGLSPGSIPIGIFGRIPPIYVTREVRLPLMKWHLLQRVRRYTLIDAENDHGAYTLMTRLPDPHWLRNANERLAAIFLSIILIVLGSGAAHATVQGNVVLQNWKVSDKCARQAQAAFPDFTPEANAKRDASLKACLDGQMLPPRQPVTPGH